MGSEYLSGSELASVYDLDHKQWCWLLFDLKKSKRLSSGKIVYNLHEVSVKYLSMPDDDFFCRFISKKQFLLEYGKKRMATLKSVLAHRPNIAVYCSFGDGGKRGKFFLKVLLEAISYSKKKKKEKRVIDNVIPLCGHVLTVYNETSFLFVENNGNNYDCKLFGVKSDNIKDITMLEGNYQKSTSKPNGCLKVFYVTKIGVINEKV